MAEPTTALSYADLIIAVAEVAGIASYKATPNIALVPIDDFDFDKCKRIVNNGIRRFISSCPDTGWRWMTRLMEVLFYPFYTGTATAGTATSLTDNDIINTYADDFFIGYTLKITSGTGINETATITDYTGVTGKFDFSGSLSSGSTPDTTSKYRVYLSSALIDDDSARYLLDQDFGSVAGQISYAADSNKGVRIDWCNEAEIRVQREVTVRTGTPNLAAIRPYTDSSNPRRFELIVNPRPSGAFTVVFPYRVFFDKLQMEHGTATDGGATSLTDSTRIEADDYFIGWTLKIIYGTGRGETATITTYASDVFGFTALSNDSTPDNTSIYVVEPPNNLHPAGYQFDNAILHACLAQAELEFKDVESTVFTQLYYTVELPAAHKIDAQLAPRKISGAKKIQERTWNNVTYN